MMDRWLLTGLAGLTGLLVQVQSATCSEIPVSAVWDTANSSSLAVERTVWVMEDVIDQLVLHHVDGLSKFDLTECWLAATRTSDGMPPVKGAIPFVRPQPEAQTRAIKCPSGTAAVSALDSVNASRVRQRLSRLLRDYSPEQVGAFANASWTGFVKQIPGQPEMTSAVDAKVQAQLVANSYVGLGVTAGIENDFLSFPSILPGGSAQRAGLNDHVKVLAVDGWSTFQQPVNDSVARIRGPIGTWVTLRIQDQRGERDITIQRDFVRFDTVHGWDEEPRVTPGTTPRRIPEPLPEQIAYLRCSQLGGSTVHELRQAEIRIRQEGREALVLDLRSPVREGDIKYSCLVADALLGDCVLWREVDRQGTSFDVRSDSDCLFRGMPLAVLVSTSSLPSEWLLAWALRDAGRAIIVEERRHWVADVRTHSPWVKITDPTRQEFYRFEEFPVADNRSILRIPTRRVLRTGTSDDWPIAGDFVWHVVPVVPYSNPRTANESVQQKAAIDAQSKPILAQNPALPEELQSLGALGVAIQRLQQQLTRKAAL